MRKSNWIVKQQPEEAIRTLCTAMNLTPLVARLLYNRGMDTPEKAKRFLNKSIDGMHDPFLLPDMEKAVARIRQALAAQEKIQIYGDYDVDGVTATSVLYLYLKNNGGDVSYYIPDRVAEGYGLNGDALKKAAEQGVTLVITVDTGITAIEESKLAKELGISMLITDHHECGALLPDAEAIVNPKRPDSTYPFCDLAGVGVAFKVVCALAGREHLQEMVDCFAQLVCLGTVADVMPLRDENRIIVACGLKRIERTDNFGIRALLEKAGVSGRRITASTLGFSICPRINAAGRMDSASKAVELFLAPNKTKASAIAGELCDINRRRQETENVILEDAVAQITDEPHYEEDPVLVLWSSAWHHGVIGVVASRLAERYGKPVILISLEDGVGKGSGRSVRGFSLYQALSACKDRLLKFGGHDLAAGLSVAEEELEAFREDLNQYTRENMSQEALAPYEADCIIEGIDVTVKKALEILFLEPYGMGNPSPVFLLKDAFLEEVLSIGGDKHMKLLLQKDNVRMSAVYFGKSAIGFDLCRGDRVDVICNLDVNNFRGEQNAQLVVREMTLAKEAQKEMEEYEALYARYESGQRLGKEEAGKMLPSREDFVATYRWLSSGRAGTGIWELILRRMERQSSRLNMCRARICLDIFQEMGLVDWSVQDGMFTASCAKAVEKVNLDSSLILKELRKMAV